MRSDFIFVMTAAVVLAPSLPAAAQAPTAAIVAPGGHPTAVTICTGQPMLDDECIEAGMPIPVGPHVIVLTRPTVFDVQLIGGGGGGGAGRAAKESDGGVGGKHAETVPIFQRMMLERGKYLIEVGAGGAGGNGAWHWSAPPFLSNGGNGGDTRLRRCSSGALLAIVKGGSGGAGDGATTGVGRGNDGDDFVDPVSGERLGRCGAGGIGVPWESNRRGGDGTGAVGAGAGGGGQGRTDLQIDGPGPRSHGGKGADGLAKLTRIGH